MYVNHISFKRPLFKFLLQISPSILCRIRIKYNQKKLFFIYKFVNWYIAIKDIMDRLKA